MTERDQNAPGEALLPRPPGVFRRWLAAHPRLVDGFIVGWYLFGCALAIGFDIAINAVAGSLPNLDEGATASLQRLDGYLSWPWVLVSLAIIAVTATSLAYRRRFPLAGVAIVAVLLFFEQGLLAGPNSVALFFLLYAVPVYRGVRAGWIAFAIAFASSSLAVLLTNGSGSGVIGPAGVAVVESDLSSADRLIVGLANGVWLFAVLLIGINFGNRRRYIQALIDRAHQLARDREQRAQLAVAAERARIAREMHDIVAHSLSVVVTLSEAAAVAIDARPEAAKTAIVRSAETGREALVEMRRLLGVLNDEESRGSGEPVSTVPFGPKQPLAPQPGLAELPPLLESFNEAGLRVNLSQEGTSVGDAQQQLVVYRVIQEGLTNVLRHAGPDAEVSVSIRHSTEESSDGVSGKATVIDIVDFRAGTWGDQVKLPSPIPGSGRGLAGIHERVRMFGGAVDAGPHERGWRLHAVIPEGA